MKCPNCNNELMNVNGRYICVECGTEVPANQMENDLSSYNQMATEPDSVPTTSEPNLAADMPIEPAAVDSTTDITPKVEEVAGKSSETLDSTVPTSDIEPIEQPEVEIPVAETVESEISVPAFQTEVSMPEIPTESEDAPSIDDAVAVESEMSLDQTNVDNNPIDAITENLHCLVIR